MPTDVTNQASADADVLVMCTLLRVASPLGLDAEELEVKSARHLGNFPQAFSHLALIEAVSRIVLDERIQEYS